MDHLFPEDKKKPLGTRVSDLAGDVSVSASAAGVELLLGNPEGAIIASVFGPVVTRFLGELLSQIGSKREKKRALNVLTIAARRIDERIAAGETPRLEDSTALRSSNGLTAEELLEGLVLIAQREHDRKKLEPLGRFVASLPFEPEISTSYIDVLIRLISNLSHTQLCLLAIFYDTDRWDLRADPYYVDEPSGDTVEFPNDLGEVLYQTFDLWQRGLLHMRQYERGRYPLPGESAIIPGRMMTHSAGDHIVILAELDRIDPAYLAPIIATLKQGVTLT